MDRRSRRVRDDLETLYLRSWSPPSGDDRSSEYIENDFGNIDDYREKYKNRRGNREIRQDRRDHHVRIHRGYEDSLRYDLLRQAHLDMVRRREFGDGRRLLRSDPGYHGTDTYSDVRHLDTARYVTLTNEYLERQKPHQTRRQSVDESTRRADSDRRRAGSEPYRERLPNIPHQSRHSRRRYPESKSDSGILRDMRHSQGPSREMLVTTLPSITRPPGAESDYGTVRDYMADRARRMNRST